MDLSRYLGFRPNYRFFQPQSEVRETRSGRSKCVHSSEGRERIWIDLDNSPHVPFFIPIIEELEKRGYSTFLTARDAYQVVELLDLHHLSCVRIGRHYGKSRR